METTTKKTKKTAPKKYKTVWAIYGDSGWGDIELKGCYDKSQYSLSDVKRKAQELGVRKAEIHNYRQYYGI